MTICTAIYAPAAHNGRAVAAARFSRCSRARRWKAKVFAAWPGVQLTAVQTPVTRGGFSRLGALEVDVALNGLAPSDIRVECVVHRAMCSELTVPVRRYAENKHAMEGVTAIDGKTVLIETLEPAAAGRGQVPLSVEPQATVGGHAALRDSRGAAASQSHASLRARTHAQAIGACPPMPFLGQAP